MHKNQSVSSCNDYVIVTMIHETYNDLMNRYNIFSLIDPTTILSKPL
jgi:hypothetical protein